MDSFKGIQKGSGFLRVEEAGITFSLKQGLGFLRGSRRVFLRIQFLGLEEVGVTFSLKKGLGFL